MEEEFPLQSTRFFLVSNFAVATICFLAHRDDLA